MKNDASDAPSAINDTDSRSPAMGERKSPVQIETKRRNARKSTGSNPPAGQAVAKRNAPLLTMEVSPPC